MRGTWVTTPFLILMALIHQISSSALAAEASELAEARRAQEAGGTAYSPEINGAETTSGSSHVAPQDGPVISANTIADNLANTPPAREDADEIDAMQLLTNDGHLSALSNT